MSTRIDFCYYFFKANDRKYDLAELFAYFQAQPYISVTRTNEEERIVRYDNPILNFGASFVFSTRSVLSNLHLLDGRYLDLNFRLQLDEPIISTAKLSVLIDLVGKVCQRFNFAIYSPLFTDVSPFKKTMLVKAYDMFKAAYKDKYEEDFSPFGKLESHVLENVTNFYVERKSIESHYNNTIKSLDYLFFKEDGLRKVYVASSWDGSNAFILPPQVSLMVINNGVKNILIPYKDFAKKLGRLLKPHTGDPTCLVIHEKDLKKARKIVLKTNFKEIRIPISQISLDKILEI